MEDIVINKYKKLLKKCLDKGISLEIIQQIILASQLKNKEKIVEQLLKIVDTATEQQMKQKIAKLIEENN